MNELLSNDDIVFIHNVLYNVIQDISIDGKSTNQIFGEIYTRFRNRITYDSRAHLKKIFSARLKKISWTAEGKILNGIINKLWERRRIQYCSTGNLELHLAIMENYLKESKDVNQQSGQVFSELSRIEQFFNGECYG